MFPIQVIVKGSFGVVYKLLSNGDERDSYFGSFVDCFFVREGKVISCTEIVEGDVIYAIHRLRGGSWGNDFLCRP
jgi:hypothetical protein